MAVDLTALNNDYDLLLAFPLIEENIVATAKWFEGINPIGGVSDGVKRWSTSGYVERYQGSTSSFVPLEWSKVVFGNSFGIVDDADIGLTISLDGSNQTLLDAANGLLLRVNGTDVIKAYASGFAGVNTANPAYAWDVTGDINFTGTLYNNGSAVSLVTQTYVDAADTNLQSQITTLGTTDTSLQNQINTLGTTDTSLQTQITTLTSVIAQTSANFRGEWSSATTYQQYDQVLRNGIRYYSQVSSNLNNDPASSPAQWSLFVNVFSGNVGIGTSSPEAILHLKDITPTSDNVCLRLENDAQVWELCNRGFDNDKFTIYDVTADNVPLKIEKSSPTNSFYIKSDGNVGIGTSSPDASLHITKSGDAPAILRLERNDSSVNSGDVFGSIEFESNDASTGSSGVVGVINVMAEDVTPDSSMRFFTSTNNSGTRDLTEKMRITSDGDVELPKIAGRSYSLPLVTSVNPNLVTGTNFNSIPVQVGDEITFYNNQVRTVTAVTNTQLTVDQNWTTSFAATSATGKAGIGFNTKDTESMRITADGNVGIGDNLPDVRLEIAKANTSTGLGSGGLLQLTNTSGSAFNQRAEILFKNVGQITSAISSSYTTFSNPEYGGELVFATKHHTDTEIQEQMRIDSQGRVGIGTSSPGAKLHATGDIVAQNATNPTVSANDNGTLGASDKSVYMRYDTVNDVGVLGSFHNGTGAKNLILNQLGGNVGIGTSAPSHHLDVSGSGSGIYSANFTNTHGNGNGVLINAGALDTNFPLRVRNSSSTDLLSVRANGNVGIGTSAPDAPLSVKKVSGTGTAFGVTDSSDTLLGSVYVDQSQGAVFVAADNSGTNKVFLSSYGDSYFLYGNVGIGTDQPSAKLHTYGANSGGTDITAIRVENNGGVSASLIAYQNSHAEIRLGTAHDLLFKTDDNNERCRVTNSGDFKIKNGNLVIQTAGKGIDFSANAQSPGMTSELLDSYEEGSFTPYLYGSTTAGVFTYTNQNGRYTKIGNLVQYQITLSASGTTTSPVGDMTIRGLPFTSKSTANVFGSVRIGWTQNITGGADLGGYVVNNQTYIRLRNITNGSGNSLQGSDVGSAFYFIVTGTYQT